MTKTLLGGLLMLSMGAAAPVHAQFSTPMRDVENPDRSPFMISGFGTLTPPFINGFVQFATPLGKRYFIEYATLSCTTPSATDQITQAVLSVQQNTSATSSAGFGGPVLQMTRRGPAPFGGYVWAGAAELKMFSDPALGTTDGGSAISFNIFRTEAAINVTCSGLITGHTLPQ
jgi:hypothetical protein